MSYAGSMGEVTSGGTDVVAAPPGLIRNALVQTVLTATHVTFANNVVNNMQ